MEIFMADMKAGEVWGINERAVEKGCTHTFISARRGLKHGSWETEHDQIARLICDQIYKNRKDLI